VVNENDVEDADVEVDSGCELDDEMGPCDGQRSVDTGRLPSNPCRGEFVRVPALESSLSLLESTRESCASRGLGVPNGLAVC
jgi:hypothetical protein